MSLAFPCRDGAEQFGAVVVVAFLQGSTRACAGEGCLHPPSSCGCHLPQGRKTHRPLRVWSEQWQGEIQRGTRPCACSGLASLPPSPRLRRTGKGGKPTGAEAFSPPGEWFRLRNRGVFTPTVILRMPPPSREESFLPFRGVRSFTTGRGVAPTARVWHP